MATAEEILLAAGEAENGALEVLTIDNDLRTITVPESVRNLGVEGDDDVKRLRFAMPRRYGEFDLSIFAVHIVYVNASNEPDLYIVTDAESSTNEIRFSWLIGENALKYKGTAKFAVHLRRVENGRVTQRFNTEPAAVQVLDGLDADLTEEEQEKARDILTQLLAMLDAKAEELVQVIKKAGDARTAEVNTAGAAQVAAIENKGSNTLAAIPEDYTAMDTDVKSLKDQTADLLMGMPHKEALELRSGIVHNGGNIDSPQDGANTCYAYKYIPTGKGYSVEFDSSVYTVAAAFFTEEKKYVNVVGFFTTQSPYILPKNAQNSPYVVVEFRRKDGATITEDEAAALGAALNYPVYPGTRRIITLTEDVYEQFIVTQDCDIIGNGYEVSLGVELDDGSNSGVFSVAYEAAEGTCTHRVFVTKDLEVENTTASRPYYYVTLWSIAEDTANDKILTPLMTEGEVNATPDSFTYNGTAFVINSTGHKRIVMAQDYEVNGPGELRYGLYINGAYNVNVYNAKFNFAGMYGARISNGANVNFYNCEFGYAKTASGLYAIDSVVNCFGCIANHNRNDGFNYHNTGEGLAVECSGSYNADDGISNHDSFALRINGGRFIGNGKGGVACPTHGAACDIANVYCSGNQAGIYAVSDTATSETVIVQGALLKDNTYPFWIKNYDVIAVNVAMVNNINEARIDSGSLTEY